jgi:tRNA(His) 5'-end guanylyltransferase
MSNDNLGDRMKSYEDAYRTHLPIRMPVILRIDGKAFHTYTKGCKRPLDQGLIDCMNETAKYLCEHVQGCQIAYVQSDEISLLLNNYTDVDTQSWFDNNLQKMVSISASMASVTFTMNSWQIWAPKTSAEVDAGADPMSECDFNRPAYFDSRAFIVPKEEVVNYFLWRQQDATRNSVQMLACTLYSHKQLEGKGNSELQELCFQKGINWNDCPTSQKRGRCIVKTKVMKQGTNPKTGEVFNAERTEWVVDNEIPIFSQDRSYIEKHVYVSKRFNDMVKAVGDLETTVLATRIPPK